MAKYRKKPVVIEAWRVPAKPPKFDEAPAWIIDALARGTCRALGTSPPHIIEIKTLEGDMVAKPGDWIIQGIKGELYPCRDDIFQATYEPAGLAPGEPPS